MRINFKHLILHNFMSFGHSELSIYDDGFIRVSGENHSTTDMAMSNGSGKSSLWESIVWALTGETIRGTKQVSNLYGDDGTYVSIDFTIDNTQYTIIRAKDHCKYKTSLQIFIDGKDCSGKGIRDSEKLLTQYLPDITANLLGSVIILGQGLPNRFTNNTPSGRKEVLEKLSKSDFMIEDVKNRVSSRKTVLSDELAELNTTIAKEESKKDLLASQIERDKKALEGIDTNEWRVSEAEFEIRQRDLAAQLETLRNALASKTEEVAGINVKLSSLQDSLNKKESSIKDEWMVNKCPLLEQVSQLTSECNMTSKQISDNEKVKDICPTCGQKLPGVFKPDNTSLNEKLSALNVQLESAKAALSSLDEKYRVLLKEHSDASNKMLSDIRAAYQNAYSEYSQLSRQVTTVETDYNTVNMQLISIRNRLSQAGAKIEALQQSIEENTAQIVDIDKDLLYYIDRQNQVKERLSVITKFDTLIKRDFRGFLLSNVIEFIEKRSKEYSRIIFDTEDVSFELNGNNIDISYQGKNYENLSGGEKQKVDIIVQFSIRDMLCQQVGFSSNILVLDEVFDGLDNLGCQRVISMITNLQDVRNVFIVTHRKDLSIPCDKDLIVIKSSNGISRIKE